MSRELAAVLFVAIVAAEIGLRVSEAINKAVTWACPCSEAHR